MGSCLVCVPCGACLLSGWAAGGRRPPRAAAPCTALPANPLPARAPPCPWRADQARAFHESLYKQKLASLLEKKKLTEGDDEELRKMQVGVWAGRGVVWGQGGQPGG